MSLKNIWFLCLLDCHSLMFLGKKKIAAKLINLFFNILTLWNCETSLPRGSPSLILSYFLYLSSSLISFVSSSSSFLFQYSYSVYITVRHLSPEAPHHITSSFIFVFFSLFVSSRFLSFICLFSCCYILSAQQWDITPLGPLYHSILSLQKIPSTSKEPLKLLVEWFSVTLSLTNARKNPKILIIYYFT